MEDLNFITITPIFKILALVQLFLFIVLFLITLFFKIYQRHFATKELKLINSFNTFLLNFDTLSFNDIECLKKHRQLSFEVFYLLEKQGIFINNQMIQDIINALFLDPINKDVMSKSWPIRNHAALNYQLRNKYLKNMNAVDEADLLILLADPIPVIAINAAIAICYCPSQQSIDTFIDIFSQNRRAQYDLLTEVLHTSALKIMPFVEKRLSQEKNIYIRVFCYRMLRQLPKIKIDLPDLESDINSTIIDLRLAALAYIAYAQTDNYKLHLSNAINADAWELRARAAKLIGYTKDESFLELLTLHLTDKVWWVRYRSAEALSLMGEKGETILNSQKIDVDKFAYEISQQQLEFSTNQKKR